MAGGGRTEEDWGRGEIFCRRGPHVYPPSPKTHPPLQRLSTLSRSLMKDGSMAGREGVPFCLKGKNVFYTFLRCRETKASETDTAAVPLPALPLAKVLGGRGGGCLRRGEGTFVQKGPPPSSRLNSFQPYPDPLMKTQVIGQPGMEGGGEDVPLPHGNGEPVDPGEYSPRRGRSFQ